LRVPAISPVVGVISVFPRVYRNFEVFAVMPGAASQGFTHA
jgi:hypothetical protein